MRRVVRLTIGTETIQRGFGGLGRWPPIKQQRHPRAGGLYAMFLLFSSRAARECEATRPGEARQGDRAPAPMCVGFVLRPGGGCRARRRAKQKAASGLAPTCFYQQVGARTGKAAMRKNEERKKHDRLSPLLPAGRKLLPVPLKNKHFKGKCWTAWRAFLLTSDDECLVSCERKGLAGQPLAQSAYRSGWCLPRASFRSSRLLSR